MEKKPQHTPTPWHQAGQYINDDKGNIIADVLTDLGVHDANAAFIVRAVNSHDKLLNLLEQCRIYVEAAAELIAENRDDNATELGLVRSINVAIAKAEGK